MKCPERRRDGRRKKSASCRESNRGSSVVQSDVRRSVTVPTIRLLLCSARDASSCSIKGETFLDQRACQIVNKIIELRHSDVAMATATACFVQNRHKLARMGARSTCCTRSFFNRDEILHNQSRNFCFLASRNVAVLQRTLTVFVMYVCVFVCLHDGAKHQQCALTGNFFRN
jgi:hypothetical protein